MVEKTFLQRAKRRFRLTKNDILSRHHVKQRMRHLSGPAQFDLADDEIALVMLGRNISYYVDDFVQHHRDLGAEYIVYIDNGSDDDTVDRVAAYDKTIVARCDANFRLHQNHMRMASATRFVKGGWRLALDPDEMLDYPGINRRRLPDLIDYMNQHGYTGLIAQMLEMVPPGPLRPEDSVTFKTALERFNSYSLENISRFDYHSVESKLDGFLRQNRMDFDPIKVMYGGIRNTLFGEDCCMSKHVLFRMGPEVKPLVQPHATTGLNCADFTVALRHYKFAGDFLQRERKRLAQNRVRHTETAQRVQTMDKNPNMSFLVSSSRLDPTPEGLLEDGFIVASDRARKFLLGQ